jgi:tripartite-type tricarboxylate transporter receptor subunit TctC
MKKTIAPMCFLFMSICILAHADDFYKGKNLTILIGSPAGGVYDITARLYGRHISKFIPGNPVAVMQNMPGAGGVRAANYLYNAAPKDGTTIALTLDNLLLNQFLTPDEVKFSAEKFTWIGRGDRPTRIVYSWTASGIKSVADAKVRDVLTGMTAPGTASEMYPSLANALVGTRFKLISGYDGAGGMNLALERGEIEAVGANSWLSMLVTKAEWVSSAKVTPLFQTTLSRDPELASTPTLLELAPNDQARAIITFQSRGEEIGFFLIAPPQIPADRAKMLRYAFSSMARSSDYLAETKSLNMGTNFLSGEKLQAIATDEAATPLETIAMFKAAASARR